MKYLKKIMGKDFFLLSIILLVAFYVWNPLTRFALTGLGFVYLSKYFQYQHLSSFIDLASFYWFAIVQGIIYSNLFTTNMSLYFWTELMFMFATFILFYYLLLSLFNKRLIAFLGTLMFSVNFFGHIDMFASGIYPWFQERIPLMLLLIPSFIFLHKFLVKSEKKYLIYSFLLYFLGISIGHWGILFTAPYFFYPIFWGLHQRNRKIKGLFKFAFIGTGFLLITTFFVFIQSLILPGAGPYWGFLEFLLQPGYYQYPEKVFRQLIYWSSYLPIFEIFSRGLPLYPPSPLYFFTNPDYSMRYANIVAATYIAAAILIYLKLPAYRALFFTTIFSLLSLFYLSAYFGRYEIFTQPGSNRYLYLPTYLLIIFWSLFILAVFKHDKRRIQRLFKAKILITVIIIVIYLFFNIWLIQDSLKWKLERYDVTNILWKYVVKRANGLEKNTLIVLPFSNFDPQAILFLQEHLEGPIFSTSEDEWEKISTSSATKATIKIEYDAFCKCAKEIKIDRTLLK